MAGEVGLEEVSLNSLWIKCHFGEEHVSSEISSIGKNNLTDHFSATNGKEV